MPQGNAFRHQRYSSGPPVPPCFLLQPELPPPLETAAAQQRMRRVGQVLREQHVAAVYLVHGTFTGNDILGVLRELEWVAPQWSEPLRQQHKLLADRLAGQAGNFTSEFAAQFESLINGPSDSPLPVRLFNWSGENHHLGRADAAVELLSELVQRLGQGRQRVLLWGHSHAGNVFALMTNLLGGSQEVRGRFFRAGYPYYGWSLPGTIRVSPWSRLRALLTQDPQLPQRLELDLVTFGTPIRYGWETLGYRRLLHITHHRPVPGLAPYLAAFPFGVQDLLEARQGDYVQQLGIAGTNLPTSLLSLRHAIAEHRLSDLLQHDMHWQDTLQHLQLGQRVPDEGPTLLVDYSAGNAKLNQQLFGHAIYTRPEWLLMHAEEIVRESIARSRKTLHKLTDMGRIHSRLLARIAARLARTLELVGHPAPTGRH